MGSKKPDEKEIKDSKMASDTSSKKAKIIVTKLIKSKHLSTTLSMEDNPFLMSTEVV
jgi:hypothetical protein